MVGKPNRGTNLLRVGEQHGDRRKFTALHQRRECCSLDVLHAQIDKTFFYANVINGDDVGMVEIAGGLGLAHQALRQRIAFFRSAAQGNGFQRHRPVDELVVGLIHHAHGAAPQFRLDLIAAFSGLKGLKIGGRFRIGLQ